MNLIYIESIINSSKRKINDYFEFPLQLNFKEFCTESVSPSDSLGFLPPDYFEYDLRGVILHSGTTEHGHYTSLISDRDIKNYQNSWYEFNDSNINQITIEDIKDLSYGGKYKVYFLQRTDELNGAHEDAYMKTKNAYILFYERRNCYNYDQICELKFKKVENNSEQKSNEMNFLLKPQNPQNASLDKELQQIIREENTKYSYTKIIFTKSFHEFLKQLIFSQIPPTIDNYK